MTPIELPTVLALDFDGVLCDGLIEYFETAWRAYCRIWSIDDHIPPAGLAEQFYRLRPVVESGWEMPVLLHSILIGVSEDEILADWNTIAPNQAQASGVSSAELAATVDRVRDEWIAADITSWLDLHRFYPGVIERLQQVLSSSISLVIISTKEGRFVRQLLQQQQVNLPESQIFGKEVQQPKSQTLRDLTQKFMQGSMLPTIWFVEDRLKTLQHIAVQADLTHVALYLADWGYNTPTDRTIAQQDSRIHLLSLVKFSQAFSNWN